jgi:serine palmitoyltransferase
MTFSLTLSADVHDTLEKHLARFYGATDAILYPSAYATMSSIIPTFAARGELLVV